MNPSVFSSNYLRISNVVFPLFSLIFWILTEFSVFYSNSLLLKKMSFTVGCFPFYSVILGFHLLPWVLEPMLCQQHWWLVSSSFFIIFFFWDSFFKKPLADFSIMGHPRRLTFVLSFSKVFRFYFSSNPPFSCFSFCHFSQVSW